MVCLIKGSNNQTTVRQGLHADQYLQEGNRAAGRQYKKTGWGKSDSGNDAYSGMSCI